MMMQIIQLIILTCIIGDAFPAAPYHPLNSLALFKGFPVKEEYFSSHSPSVVRSVIIGKKRFVVAQHCSLYGANLSQDNNANQANAAKVDVHSREKFLYDIKTEAETQHNMHEYGEVSLFEGPDKRVATVAFWFKSVKGSDIDDAIQQALMVRIACKDYSLQSSAYITYAILQLFALTRVTAIKGKTYYQHFQVPDLPIIKEAVESLGFFGHCIKPKAGKEGSFKPGLYHSWSKDRVAPGLLPFFDPRLFDRLAKAHITRESKLCAVDEVVLYNDKEGDREFLTEEVEQEFQKEIDAIFQSSI